MLSCNTIMPNALAAKARSGGIPLVCAVKKALANPIKMPTISSERTGAQRMPLPDGFEQRIVER